MQIIKAILFFGSVIIFIFKLMKMLFAPMKQIFVFAAVFLLAVNVVYGQNGWITHKMDDRVSVKLPGKPTWIQAGTDSLKDKDGLIYFAILVDFVKIDDIDSATFAKYLPTQEMATSLKTGMLSKIANSNFGDVKIDRWMGHYRYTAEGENAEMKLKFYTYMVIIGTKMYGLTVVVPDGKSPKGKDDFFASLTFH